MGMFSVCTCIGHSRTAAHTAVDCGALCWHVTPCLTQLHAANRMHATCTQNANSQPLPKIIMLHVCKAPVHKRKHVPCTCIPFSTCICMQHYDCSGGSSGNCSEYMFDASVSWETLRIPAEAVAAASFIHSAHHIMHSKLCMCATHAHCW